MPGERQPAPAASSQEHSSDSEDKEEMDLHKALKIVTKHYSRRNAQLSIMDSFSRGLTTIGLLRRLQGTLLLMCERAQTDCCPLPLFLALFVCMCLAWCRDKKGEKKDANSKRKRCALVILTTYSMLWASVLPIPHLRQMYFYGQ